MFEITFCRERKAQLGPDVREAFAFACAGRDKVLTIARDGVVIRPSRHAVGKSWQLYSFLLSFETVEIDVK